MSEYWDLRRSESELEPQLYDIRLVQTANPFGDFLVAKIDDIEGDRFGKYPRGTRLDAFAAEETADGTLNVADGETEDVDNDTESYLTARSAGQLRVGGDVLEVDSGNTQSVESGEESNNYEAHVEGTLQVEGTLTLDGTLRVGSPSTIEEFTGFVVERRGIDEQGAEALEVEAYTFDQFLRRGTVSNDQSGNLISAALKDIIETDTPVEWVADNVTVGDDHEVTRPLQGEKVENALLLLRNQSADEELGVNSDLEFFFRESEASSAPRDITDSDWFNYDIPERGKEAINEVTVFFDEGSKSVTVDDGPDKLALQEQLGSNQPITLAEEVSRPDITDITDARQVGNQILETRNTLLTGTVTTYGLLDTDPGDTINIKITPRGIDGEFRIAEVDYRWRDGTTQLTIVEKRGDQDDLLVRLSDSVKRVEMADADRSVPSTRAVSTTIGGEVTVEGDVDGDDYTAVAVTNVARNAIRDSWAGGTPPNIAEIAVGTDGSTPKRSQTALGNETERVSASESLPDSTTARYTGSVSTTDIREVGLFASDGRMLARALVAEDANITNGDVTVDLAVSNDGDVDNGVLTTEGQTAVRDILADNTPDTPAKVAYGSDGSDPSPSEIALGNKQHTVNLSELLIQSARSTSDWEDITGALSTVPVTFENGKLKLQQSCYIIEAEDGDIKNATVLAPGSKYSDSAQNAEGAFSYGATSDYHTWTFETDYTIPSEHLAIAVRYETTGSDPVDVAWRLDNSRISSFAPNSDVGLQWNTDIISSGTDTGDLEPGTHSIELDVLAANTDNLIIDLIAIYDSRYSYTFDNAVNADNALAGPELYPDLHEITLSTAKTGRNVESATLTQSWDDTSNNQKLELSNDGGSTWHTKTNSETASATFSAAETGVDIRLGMSRYGGQSVTPTSGINGQAVSAHDLEADIDAVVADDIGQSVVRSFVLPNKIDGTTLAELGELDNDGDLLTRSIFAEFTIQVDQRVISDETISWTNP